MSAHTYALTVIRRTPIRSLSIEQVFLLELHGFMTDLRNEANKTRLSKHPNRAHLSYLTGRVHGLVFGLYTTLAFRGSIHEESPIDMARDAAMAEANFLTDQYLEGVRW